MLPVRFNCTRRLRSWNWCRGNSGKEGLRHRLETDPPGARFHVRNQTATPPPRALPTAAEETTLGVTVAEGFHYLFTHRFPYPDEISMGAAAFEISRSEVKGY